MSTDKPKAGDEELAEWTAEKIYRTLTFGALGKLNKSAKEWRKEVSSIILAAITASRAGDRHGELLRQLHREINLFGNQGVTQETARALRDAALSSRETPESTSSV